MMMSDYLAELSNDNSIDPWLSIIYLKTESLSGEKNEMDIKNFASQQLKNP